MLTEESQINSVNVAELTDIIESSFKTNSVLHYTHTF